MSTSPESLPKPSDPSVTGPRSLSVVDYANGIRARDIAIVARALTLVESINPRHQQQAEQLLTRLLPFTGTAIRVGITGPPGAGKSTFIEALGLELTQAGQRVAVLAIDPSSGVAGGSILGDKTRMPGLAAHSNAFIRPSPSAGTLGGVARRTREGMQVFEAAGYDVILVETVGVGQSEATVVDLVDCTIALMLPGAGDELQAIKRGLLEYADVIAVNKADGGQEAAAELAASQFRQALGLWYHVDTQGPDDPAPWPRVFTCSAKDRRGVDAIWQAVTGRHAQMVATESLEERRRHQQLRWLWSAVDDHLRDAVRHHPRVRKIRASLEQQVLAGTIPAEAAARQILQACAPEKAPEKGDAVP